MRSSVVSVSVSVVLVSLLSVVFMVDGQTAGSVPVAGSIGRLEFGGNGCPDGTVHVSFAPDHSSVSILFDSFIATTTSSLRNARAVCSLALPVHVPSGLSVALFKIDYRGFADIPAGATGRFSGEYFFAGEQGPKMTRIFPAGFSDDFTLTDNLSGSAISFSPCGEDVILRTNTNAMVSKLIANTVSEPTIAIDSADVASQSHIVYHFQWQRCNM